MRTYKLLAILGIAAFLMLPLMAAKATPLGTVDVSRTGHGANHAADVYGAGYAGESVHTGVYMLDKTAGTGAGTFWDNGPIAAFCIELEEPASSSNLTYDVVSVSDAYSGLLNESMGMDRSNYLSELWGRYYDPSWAGDGPFTLDQNGSAASFAAAVWEIVYEDLPANTFDWDVTADGTPGIPGFAIDSVDSSVANAWLASLNGNGPMAELAVFTNEGNQNYLVAVPEPTTMLLLGVGGVLGAMRRKRRMA
ncbi:MAG: PEP-CTERM sorting domain-containing protein [Planctomycetes bacterium]|nr:PEP-CTERM sorting domain-containing protein [Planctomycetota bacterium]